MPTLLKLQHRAYAALVCAAGLAALMLAQAQAVGSGMTDMLMADRHAALAADAARLADIRLHWQHVLNCLEGLQGPDYRAAVGNPCSGAGVIHELPDKSVNCIRVNKAIRLAAVGVTFQDLKPAHFTAQAVQAMLNEGGREADAQATAP